MPEPTTSCLGRKFPAVSIVRPTETKGIAMGVVKFLTDDGPVPRPVAGVLHGADDAGPAG